jgi:hypothetical protein
MILVVLYIYVMHRNPSFENLCSKCFKMLKNPSPPVSVKQQQMATTTTPTAQPPPLQTATTEVGVDLSTTSSDASQSTVTPANEVASQVVQQAIETLPPSSPAVAAEPSEETTAAAASSSEEQGPVRPVQERKDRCFKCNSKVSLNKSINIHTFMYITILYTRKQITIAKQITNKCRCEYIYCDNHRNPDQHDCDFDHLQMQKDLLAKRVPKLMDRKSGGRSFTRID